MDADLENTLYSKYPNFFSNKDKSPMESCMSMGIECGNGWYDLINTICWEIQQRNKNIESRNKYNPENNEKLLDFKFDQIKEKFGGLRVYYSGGDDYVRGLVDLAETMSYRICENCGNKGYANKNGWILTLCDSCRNSLKKPS